MALKMENAKYEWMSQQAAEELDILREENEKLYENLESSNNAVTALKENKQDLEQQVADYKKGYNSKLEILVHAETEVKNLMQENAMLKQKADSFEQELTHHSAQMETLFEKLKSDLQVTRNELTDQRKEMSRLKQENLSKDFKIDELKRYLHEQETVSHKPAEKVNGSN